MRSRKEAQQQNLKQLVWAMLLLAVMSAVLALLLPDYGAEAPMYAVTTEERYGFYAMGVLFGVIGIFCLSSLWQKKRHISMH